MLPSAVTVSLSAHFVAMLADSSGDFVTPMLTNASSDWRGSLLNASLLDDNQTCIFNVSRSDPIVDDFSVGYKVCVGILYGGSS